MAEKLTEQQQQEKLLQLNSVFSPSAPIISRDLFYGRTRQLDSVSEMVQERGQHGVLYGERGVGKTSLANIILETYKGALTTKVVCSGNESFKELWQRALGQLSFTYLHSGLGFDAEEKQETFQLDLFLPPKETIDPTDIQNVLARVTNRVLIIFDEFDGVIDPRVRTRFADTIKALSDNAPQIKILIVGIANSVSDLIGDHPSIERSLKQILMPRMSREELAEIVNKGLPRLGMTIVPEVLDDILTFSGGFPHYTHLLAKYSAKAALSGRETRVTREHFDFAISEAVENVQESVRNAFEKAVLSIKPNAMFESTLFACALVPADEHGTFRATDLQESLKRIAAKDVPIQGYIYHLGKLCQQERGSVLERTSGKKARYRFKNPLLKAFVRIRLYQKGQLNGAGNAPRAKSDA